MEEASDDIRSLIEAALHDKLDLEDVVFRGSISGGLVNKACLIESKKGKNFVKYSQRSNAISMFEAECASLKAIADTDTVRVPKPVKVIPLSGTGALLIMEYLEDLTPVTTQWEDIGLKLAKLHNHNLRLLEETKAAETSIHHAGNEGPQPVTRFGFYTPTYYGPKFCIPPVWTDTWQEYFTRFMLKPQFDEIEERTGDQEFRELWSQLQLVVHRVFEGAVLKPSLTHGDFCHINCGVLNGETVLYDPCSKYAPHDTDLTILYMDEEFKLPQDFHSAYHDVLPKTRGFELRMAAEVTFGLTLTYNVPGEEAIKPKALKAARNLLSKLTA